MMTNQLIQKQKSLPPSDARTIALEILRKIQGRRMLADDVLDLWFNKVPLDSRDQALVFELVYGVMRHQGTLDWYLRRVMHYQLGKLPLPVVLALRLGTYQIFYLNKIPQSAAVNESVNLVKKLLGEKWTGLVNAVLRNLLRHPPPPFPDLTDEPIDALSIRYSCPAWLVKRWVTQFGIEGAEHACRHTIQIPPMTLRTNVLRCSRDELMKKLSKDGLLATPTAISPVGVIIDKCGSLTQLRPLQEGWCYVEDEAAQLVPLILYPQPGHRVLDACSAPGGKTTHIAMLMKNEGEIVSLDKQTRRLKRVRENCQRLGISIVQPCTFDLLKEELSHKEFQYFGMLPETYDRILVDAPCSGLGVLRRHPEAKWSRQPEHLPKHQEFQLGLLHKVSRLLRPGGVLVYSACSVEPEESSHVISRFCRDHPGFSHETATPWLPPLGRSLVNQDGNLMTMAPPYEMDGFFAARLQKKRKE